MKQKITLIMIGIFAIVSVISISFTFSYFGTADNLLEERANETTPQETQVQQKMESKTIRSVPEVHSDIVNHQFVIVLPSDNKIYDGKITWVSSQPVLPAVLHGPLDTTQTNGQFAASIDEGKTIHAITVASPQLLNGTYSFVGNGLIMHNIENHPFWISYSVSYKEMKNPIINSFEECIAAGNPAMESYPRQCYTQDGKHFVEEIS